MTTGLDYKLLKAVATITEEEQLMYKIVKLKKKLTKYLDGRESFLRMYGSYDVESQKTFEVNISGELLELNVLLRQVKNIQDKRYDDILNGKIGR